MERFPNTGQPDWDWWGRLWPTPGETLREVGVTPGDSLSAVGCGNGYFALPAARITAPEPVYALDLDEDLLGELERLATQHAIENVVPVQGDARNLPESLPERVDTVLVANTLHGVSDPQRFVEGAFEVLRPGGRFLVVNWHDRPRSETTILDEPRGPPTERRMAPAETRAVVAAAADVTRTRRIELPPYHYALSFQR